MKVKLLQAIVISRINKIIYILSIIIIILYMAQKLQVFYSPNRSITPINDSVWNAVFEYKQSDCLECNSIKGSLPSNKIFNLF